MGTLSDFNSADKKWKKGVKAGLKEDPWRLLTGFDPINTYLWNTILGRDDKPLGGWFGGPTSDQKRELGMDAGERKAAGIGQAISALIALMVGGGFLAGGAGGAGGGGTAVGSASQGAAGWGQLGTGASSSAAPSGLAELATAGGGGGVIGGSGGGSAGSAATGAGPFGQVIGSNYAGGSNINAGWGAGGEKAGGFWSNPESYRMLGNMMNSLSNSMTPQQQAAVDLFRRSQGGVLAAGGPTQQEEKKSDPAQVAMANAMIAAEAMKALQQKQGGLYGLGQTYLG